MIGYGCKDNGINEIIKEDFDYQHKPSFIVDKYAGDMVVEFGKEIKAVLHKTILVFVNNFISTVYGLKGRKVMARIL